MSDERATMRRVENAEVARHDLELAWGFLLGAKHHIQDGAVITDAHRAMMRRIRYDVSALSAMVDEQEGDGEMFVLRDDDTTGVVEGKP